MLNQLVSVSLNTKLTCGVFVSRIAKIVFTELMCFKPLNKVDLPEKMRLEIKIGKLLLREIVVNTSSRQTTPR
ncbi:hypothetical protein DRP05_02485 [Archaeoglobales archaeon]|nr:MAG: hypothetical protein DRP05_02485 [Archaeoglobales archaeon]